MYSSLVYVGKSQLSLSPTVNDSKSKKGRKGNAAENDEDSWETESEESNEERKKAVARLNNSSSDKTKTSLDKYDFDKYYPEDEEGFVPGGLAGAVLFEKNEKDPYLTLEVSDDEEIEDFTLKPSDAVLLLGRSDDDFSSMEVHVFEEDEENIYVHHDVIIPAFPLSLNFLGVEPGTGTPGNFVAVATMRPEIEIWNLDIVDSLEPAAVLGGFEAAYASKLAKEQKIQDEMLQADDDDNATKKKKSGSSKQLPTNPRLEKLLKKPIYMQGSHTDSVLSVCWNKLQPNILASASADGTVKLWDLGSLQCVATLTHHKSKVQCVAWHPVDPTVLLTASFDKTAAVCNVRDGTVVRFQLGAEVETAAWYPHQPEHFFATTDSGLVHMFNIKNNASPVFTVHAHNGPVSAFSVSPCVPELIATGSTDKTIKFWDIRGNKPTCVLSRDFGLGPIFCCAFSPDPSLRIAICGGSSRVIVFDGFDSKDLRNRYGSLVPGPSEAKLKLREERKLEAQNEESNRDAKPSKRKAKKTGNGDEDDMAGVVEYNASDHEDDAEMEDTLQGMNQMVIDAKTMDG
eukprot:comp20480_c0_seq1/m.41303 comp20480_c0_seq1/g.41303  ORF comp20480_c0_seq1/g.41303 comp20480_c0_seq1/m.41303 type:complete len:571 (-) comp20480_c0_seq1:55-1767(-)